MAVSLKFPHILPQQVPLPGVSVLKQWCCEEIFHTPTLTIGKKIYPLPLL